MGSSVHRPEPSATFASQSPFQFSNLKDSSLYEDKLTNNNDLLFMKANNVDMDLLKF